MRCPSQDAHRQPKQGHPRAPHHRREEDSPCHATKAHLEVLPGALGFKEMKEDVHGRRVPKVVAQYSERPHEGPAVGMQLGGGHIDLR